jgi:hypothetical protein
MTGSVPIYKLHGSLNWSLEGKVLVLYQDMRAAYRARGNAAIIPPTPEKPVPSWLPNRLAGGSTGAANI